ncbi:DUF2225 domain-containing protein [Bacillus mesophilus]|uniref:DUF2225 domain-containing protein n=2 Tax=Bacillus mesophilus TaxID=1808955 RepID=A0A6M0Q992_9BACI|nr:DUF2225 domain-containing protein [Bacillus mesophilus]
MEILFDKNVTCSACSHSYTTKKVRSRFVRALQSDSDFCSYYEDEENSPLLYYVSVCPNCGYSVSEEFSAHFPPQTLQSIKTSISSNWGHRDYGTKRTVKEAIDTYKLGIYSATLKNEKSIVLAGLYMRLVWILRKERDQEQELRFTNMAVKAYVQSYINEDFRSTDMTEIKLLYLIGDLYRRIGDDKQAGVYLSKVIQQQNETIEKRIVALAKDAWQEIREKQKA